MLKPQFAKPPSMHLSGGLGAECVDDRHMRLDGVRIARHVAKLNHVRQERVQPIDGDESSGKLNGEPK